MKHAAVNAMPQGARGSTLHNAADARVRRRAAILPTRPRFISTVVRREEAIDMTISTCPWERIGRAWGMQ